MKKMLFACALSGCAALFPAGANAADPVEECSSAWSGFYVGGHAGYLSGDSDTVGAVGDADLKGFMGGPLAGYNHQFCEFVVGIEVDAGWGEADGASGVVNDIDLEPNGHGRLRFGMPFDNIMPFVAGGIAIADMDMVIPGAGKDSETHVGFTVGGGFDFMATENIVIRAEYLYDYYGDEDYNYPFGAVSVDADVHAIRGAVMWKF